MSFEQLLDAIRSWEEVYTRGYHVRWCKYAVDFFPSGKVRGEDWVDYEVWLDSPRARCERHVVVRESGEPVRRVHATYVADGVKDKWLSEPVGEDEKRSSLANVARPGYFNVPLECGTPQGVLFQDSLVDALLGYAEPGWRIEMRGIEEREGLRSLAVDRYMGNHRTRGTEAGARFGLRWIAITSVGPGFCSGGITILRRNAGASLGGMPGLRTGSSTSRASGSRHGGAALDYLE